MAATLRKLRKSLSLKLSFNSNSRGTSSSNLSSENADAKSSAASLPPPPVSFTSSFRLSRSFTHHSSKKTCAICLGSLRTGQGQAIFIAECSHHFHFNCIANNVKHGNRRCPICRSEWKDVPCQAPANVTDPQRDVVRRAQVSPSDTNQQDPNAYIVIRDLYSPSQPQQEPDRFSDDESLPTIPPIPITPSCAQAMTVKVFPEFLAVSALDSPSKFAVLSRIRAPALREAARHLDRAPIDLAAVLDVSGSMAAKLALLKRAVRFIIQNLGPSDRLSIVTFSSSARRILPLRRMSDTGREEAIRAINSLSSGGGTNIVGGLRKGVRVLDERSERNPIASIILLSDGHDTANTDTHNRGSSVQNQNQGSSNPRQKLEYFKLLPASICPINRVFRDETRQPTIPVHTFGFGFEHDSTAMHSISDASGGTFSFIESADILQDAFARCMGGLLSIVAQDVRLTMGTTSPGVKIVSIPSGSYRSEIFYQEEKALIDVGNLYADEEKEFLVYLSIPVSSAAEGEVRPERTSLLDVSCSYKDSMSLEMIQVECERAEIRRPEALSPSDNIVCLEVDRQRNRLWVAEAIADAQRKAEMGDLEGAQTVLAERRSMLLSSASAQAGDCLCNWLEAELWEIRKRMASREVYEQSGRAYALSGLSSHSWQRATTRGPSTQTSFTRGEGGNSSTNATISYETPSMVSMVSRSQTLNFTAEMEARRLNKSCSLIQRNY